jgi:hypothetical protein
MNLQIQNSFQTALKYPNPIGELRSVAENLLTDGYDTVDLLAELEGLRPQLNEEEEDNILEVMDFLTGWCNPHQQIKIPAKPAAVGIVNRERKPMPIYQSSDTLEQVEEVVEQG